MGKRSGVATCEIICAPRPWHLGPERRSQRIWSQLVPMPGIPRPYAHCLSFTACHSISERCATRLMALGSSRLHILISTTQKLFENLSKCPVTTLVRFRSSITCRPMASSTRLEVGAVSDERCSHNWQRFFNDSGHPRQQD